MELGKILEQSARFSDSVLWTYNRRFYANAGASAWEHGAVPSNATCNADIAQAYAAIILAYLRDAVRAGQVDAAHPVYVVELAAGFGRFAFQCVTKLTALLAESSLHALDVRYVMTDFAAANVRAWAAHPQLQALVASGRLELGTFDVERDHEIPLVSGGTLGTATVKNPLVVLANYAFDSFRHDLVRIEAGEAHELRVTTREPPPDLAIDMNEPESISELRIQFDQRPLPPDHFDDPMVAHVIEHYRQRLADVTLAVPTGGFAGLRRLLAMAGQRMLLVASDKGLTQEADLYHPNPHGLQFHTGALSMMVNFHAIGQYFIAQGGHYVATRRAALKLKTAVCVVGGSAEHFADTLSAARERIERFGPSECFELLNALHKLDRIEGLEQLFGLDYYLGLLRLSAWDPGALWVYTTRLREAAATADDDDLLELRIAIEQTWRNFFPANQDLAFEIARIYIAMRRPQDALRYYARSLAQFGERAATHLDIGICHARSGNVDAALQAFERALAVEPTHGLARQWITRLESERDLTHGTPVAVPGELAASVSAATSSRDG